MVFFVCEGCNETLKKAQVDGHAKKCRSCHAVTCIDCSVTFYGNDYDMHISCVSEAEKYEKSLYKGKKVKLNPQDAWMQLILLAASNSTSAPTDVKPYLGRLAEQNNVPRNKKKFCNFIKNSMSLRNDKLIDKIWSHLESVRISNKQDANNSNDNNTNNENNKNKNVIDNIDDDDEIVDKNNNISSNDNNKEKKKKKKRDREVEAELDFNKEIKKKKKKIKVHDDDDNDFVVVCGDDDDDDGNEIKKKKDKKKKKKKEKKEKKDKSGKGN